jgi:hypothetical protein
LSTAAFAVALPASATFVTAATATAATPVAIKASAAAATTTVAIKSTATTAATATAERAPKVAAAFNFEFLENAEAVTPSLGFLCEFDKILGVTDREIENSRTSIRVRLDLSNVTVKCHFFVFVALTHTCKLSDNEHDIIRSNGTASTVGHFHGSHADFPS